MKWIWRIASQKLSLWKETVKTRLGVENKWTTNLPTQPYESEVWRAIRIQWINFVNKCKIKVGKRG